MKREAILCRVDSVTCVIVCNYIENIDYRRLIFDFWRAVTKA